MPFKDHAQKLAYQVTYHANNRDHKNSASRVYHHKHRDTINQRRARNYLLNREEEIASSIAYAREHPDKKHAAAARDRARRKGAPVRDFTAIQWREMQEHYDHRCVYCRKRCKGRLTQDHITPLSKGGSHTKQNIVPACSSCNSRKNTGPPLKPIQPLLL